MLLPSRAAAATINHLLRGASWAAPRLKMHAGKTALFHVKPLSTTVLTVLESGQVAAAAPDPAAAAATFTLSPALAMRIAAGDSRAWDEVSVIGDADFAADVAYLAKNLQWEIEEDLSRIVGDVVAHRIVNTGAAFNRWGKKTTAKFTSSLAEYWTEEQPLLARSARVERFVQDVDALRDDVARLEKRIARLSEAPLRVSY